jgi:hypothetical protein
MDWHTVSVPRSVLEGGETAVRCTLLHEWGHRLISPRSLERALALAADVAAYGGLNLAEGAEVVNVAADLWVDDVWLRHPRWGEEYFCNLRSELEQVRDAASRCGGRDGTAGMVELVEAIVHVEAERAAQAGRTRLVDEPSPAAQSMLSYLYDDGLDEPDRVRRLLDDIRRMLGDAWELERLRRHLGGLQSRTLGQLLGSGGSLRHVDLARLAAELGDVGFGWKDVGAVFSRSEPDRRRRLLARTRRLALYSRLMRRLDRVIDGSRGLEPQGSRAWSPDQPLERLDVEQSLETDGVVVPEITTVQRAHEPATWSDGALGGLHVCLVIDDSGSTSGETSECEVEAALGVVEAARRFGDLTSLVVFGSSVTTSVRATRDYERVADAIALLSSDSGGTSLAPALRHAWRGVLHGPAAAGHMLVFTDTMIHDLDEALPTLEAMSRRCRVTFFCFAESGCLEDFLSTVRPLRGIACYASPTGTGFDELALREVVTARG